MIRVRLNFWGEDRVIQGEILSRSIRLSNPEGGLLKIHSEVGYDTAEAVEFPRSVADIAIQRRPAENGPQIARRRRSVRLRG